MVDGKGSAGGIFTVVQALVAALGQLTDTDESYVLVGTRANADWLESIKCDNQTIVLRDAAPEGGVSSGGGWSRKLLLSLLEPVKEYLRADPLPPCFPFQLSLSDGFWEGLGCQIVHFPFQYYEICGLPTVFNPHDLQHLHYPEYFAANELAWRESLYPTACRFSSTVVTASQWVKDDIARNYGTDPEKIQVIPWAPPTHFNELSKDTDLNAFRSDLGLPDRFILYPAVAWPHKNHLRLLEALKQLRDRFGLTVPLVCTGASPDELLAPLEIRVQELELQQQVRFLGYLSANQLRKVYQLCTAVVVPTLFEAASGPVFEAWQEGKPVACSTVTSLPEQAGDAALLFDPWSTSAIADAVRALFENAELCEDFSKKGIRRLRDFSWHRTARAYRAVYRRAAHLELSKEERKLLSWDWMKHPERKNCD